MIMEQISIKIQYYTLECICVLYDGVIEESSQFSKIQTSKEYKATLNIVHLLVVKFKKKLLSKPANCKPFKISLEYHQAFYLINFISANGSFFKGIFENTLLLQITRKIHQELHK